MDNYDCVQVFFREFHVGNLYKEENCISFEYSKEWLNKGFSLSPFVLPLKKQKFIPENNFIHDVFFASNPPFWQWHIIDNLTNIPYCCNHWENWLKIFGTFNYFGLGALHYKPKTDIIKDKEFEDLSKISEIYNKIIYSDNFENLDEKFNNPIKEGYTHRPYIIVKKGGGKYFVKGYAEFDKPFRGEEEFLYFQCAKACGINTVEAQLFDSAHHSGYLGTEFFDYKNDKELYSLNLNGTNFSDFKDIINITLNLTNDTKDAEELFKRMCFYVFTENRDNNPTNFNFVYDENSKKYKLAPDYDFEYKSPEHMQHVTSINGNKDNPSLEDILAVASQTEIDLKWAKETALFIQHKSNLLLKRIKRFY